MYSKDNERIVTARNNILFILISILLPLLGNGQDTGTKRMLFVGNSYTYFWNLPQQVSTMAMEKKISLTTKQSTVGGVNLGQHWRGERGLKTVDLIKSGDFDIVILQDHSMRAIDHPDSLLYFGKLLGDLIRANGGTPYLYLTWAREYDPLMQNEVTKTYRELAAILEAPVIPAGTAWMRARELRPGLPLYDPDSSHPSPMGAYLTACLVYGKITGLSPVGLPERLISEDKDGEKLYLNIQSREDALFCQKVAEQILNSESKE